MQPLLTTRCTHTSLPAPPPSQPLLFACSDCSSDDNWTCITFYPDLERFGMAELEAETVELMRKRVYDMAGILGKTVKVWGAWRDAQLVHVAEWIAQYGGHLGTRPLLNPTPHHHRKYPFLTRIPPPPCHTALHTACRSTTTASA